MTDPQTSALIGAILSLGTPEECKAFLTDLCTVKEIDEFSSRLEVARLLSSGVNYHDIVERTGASTATISRVSKALSGSSGGYRTALSRLGMPRVRDGVPTDKLPLLPSERAACEELRTALSGITSGNLTIDFTLTPGMEYYDDLFFVGRTGRTTEVLRGGRYDALMRRHGHDGGAVGFAVYLDALTKK